MKTWKPRQTNLGDDFGDVTVTANGVCVKIYRDGRVLTHQQTQAPANDPAADPQPGQLIAGKGVFIGTWSPKDRDGNSLNKTFNLFAAPHDLGLDENGRGTKLVATYNKAAAHVAGLQDYHGYNGFNHNVSGQGKHVPPDEALYDALRNGSYNGEWFVPPKDVLDDNLYQNKDKGDLSGTFVTSSSGSDHAHWYWSCTEHPDYWSSVCSVSFTDGDGVWDAKGLCKLSVRPVRAELRL
jgi:hypothetical protein